MQRESFGTVVVESCISFIKFFIPVIMLALSALVLWHLFSAQPQHALYACVFLSIASCIFAFSWYHAGRDIYVAYGVGFAGISLLYFSVYYAYINYALLTPQTLFWSLTAIASAAGYIALRFRGWLLAVLAVGMGIWTPSIIFLSFPRQFLAWYFVFFLALVMAAAYMRKWFELAVLSFLGFLAYNPYLFSQTDLEGTKGFLSIYQVFEIMVIIFIIYTLIPWLYSLCCAKKRIFEPICFAIGGAYTASLVHFVIENQLSFVAQLPFFIRYFVSKGVPIMNDVYMYIFVIYGGIYIGLFALLFLINKQAKVALGSLASLSIICLVGFIYTHAKATGLLPTVIKAKKIVEQVIQQVQND